MNHVAHLLPVYEPVTVCVCVIETGPILHLLVGGESRGDAHLGWKLGIYSLVFVSVKHSVIVGVVLFEECIPNTVSIIAVTVKFYGHHAHYGQYPL